MLTSTGGNSYTASGHSIYPRTTQNRDESLIRLGRRLTALRKMRGLSQVALSKVSGVAQSTISNVEHGRTDGGGFTFAVAATLADALGVELWQLLLPSSYRLGDADLDIAGWRLRMRRTQRVIELFDSANEATRAYVESVLLRESKSQRNDE